MATPAISLAGALGTERSGARFRFCSGHGYWTMTCFAAVVLFPWLLTAQLRPITGSVTESSGKVLAGARVSLDGTRYATYSDRKGKFSLALVPRGDYIIRASRSGYMSAMSALRWAGVGDQVRIVLTATPRLARVVSETDAVAPLPADSLKLPVPDSAILRRRQALVRAFVPRTGELILVPLFDGAEYTVEVDEINATPRGYRMHGRVFGAPGTTPGTAVLVLADGRVTANLRVGLRLFQIRSQARGVHLILEVDQRKLPSEADAR